MTDHKAALRVALNGPAVKRREAAADALRAFLEASGLTANEAENTLAAIGYTRPRLHLVTLYQSVSFAEQIHRDMHTFRRGTMTALYAAFADHWADYTGKTYTPEDFRSAYRAWVRKTGGGISRRARVGYERKK